MSGHDIAARMKDYFGRQIAWFDELLAESDALEAELDENAVEDFAQRQQRQARATKDLEDEFWALMHEWENTKEIADIDRESIRDLAHRAEEKSRALQTQFDKGATQAGRLADSVKETSNRLQRGKTVLDKFRSQGADGPNFVDRNA